MSNPGDCTGDSGSKFSTLSQEVSDITLLSSVSKKESVKFGSMHSQQNQNSSESASLKYSALLIDMHVR